MYMSCTRFLHSVYDCCATRNTQPVLSVGFLASDIPPPHTHTLTLRARRATWLGGGGGLPKTRILSGSSELWGDLPPSTQIHGVLGGQKALTKEVSIHFVQHDHLPPPSAKFRCIKVVSFGWCTCYAHACCFVRLSHWCLLTAFVNMLFLSFATCLSGFSIFRTS